jgi:glycosyltransferase involved in cell wall biosynthesis
MHIALITAGGAGMFCGSCMHDNTLARALLSAGQEVSLIPTYTPIRVDERDVSRHKVFLGGINVYLDAVVPLWRRLPRALVRWLDAPAVIRLLNRIPFSVDASKLGRLTVALLEGDHGPEAREIDELVRYLGSDLKPDVICFSNALLAGVLPRLRQEFPGRIFCLLQGDDIFLDALVEPWRRQALQLLRGHATLVDGFLVHSAYYRDFMAGFLQLPLDRMHVVPLGIDLDGHDGLPKETPGDPFTIGYFARICPEKGLHQLVEAFRILHKDHPRTRLLAAGYLGARDKAYFEDLLRNAADLGSAFCYAGSPPDHASKVAFLKSLDVLSVPTVYREPKGLYILEALANGIPVAQPRHGAFPELLEATGGGLLADPGDAAALARQLAELVVNPRLRFELAQRGHAAVHQRFDPRTMAEATVRALGACREVAPRSAGAVH